jgi:methyl-accepting chemotaxis protein
VINSFGAGLKQLTEGDLTHRVDQALPAVYEPLRADFNAAMATLEQTMRSITARASGIRGGTQEIASASNDLSRRTEQQAASLEQTAATLDGVTATVIKTSEGAGHAKKVVDAAKTDTQNSSRVVLETVEAMGAIERSANEVSQIIGVIDEIAFQTNLLALNAGVEAARAGDSGRGFAVVASEVRALAQRSAEAAREIKALISASTQQVARGVLLVGETGQALARISAHVDDVNGVVFEMAEASRTQAASLREINAAVNQMDQVTQQNAAMVEQSTAAANALRQETDQMAALVSQFRVDSPSTSPMLSRPQTKSAPFGLSPQAPAIPRGRVVHRG